MEEGKLLGGVDGEGGDGEGGGRRSREAADLSSLLPPLDRKQISHLQTQLNPQLWNQMAFSVVQTRSDIKLLDQSFSLECCPYFYSEPESLKVSMKMEGASVCHLKHANEPIDLSLFPTHEKVLQSVWRRAV